MSHLATVWRNSWKPTVVVASAWLILGSLLSAAMAADSVAPFLANGVKIGEVTRTQAILWARLTETSAYKTDGVDFTPRAPRDEGADSGIEKLGPAHGYGNQVPPGKKLAEMNSAVPGMEGEVRLTYWRENGDAGATVVDWIPVDNHRDFTKQFALTDLTPGTKYRFRLEGRPPGGSAPTASVENEFTTAPQTDRKAKVVFTVVTGQRWQTRDDLTNGQKIYPRMAALNPSFFVHTGDIIYYDSGDPFVTHIDLARFKWNRSYALPFVRDFHNGVPSYFMKDDHDSWQNDDWPTMDNKKMGQFTWEEGRQLFRRRGSNWVRKR